MDADALLIELIQATGTLKVHCSLQISRISLSQADTYRLWSVFPVPPLVHDFDVGSVSQARRRAVSSLSHQQYLVCRIAMVLDSDGAGHWVIVGGDGVWRFGFRVVKLVLCALVQRLVDHLHAVGVDPELFICVEALKHVPVDDDVLACGV